MTVISRWLVFLVYFFAGLHWRSIAGQPPAPAPATAIVLQGKALRLFLDHTWPSNGPLNNFKEEEPCTWNEKRVKCDHSRDTITKLNVSGLQLSGAIPLQSIAKLTDLEVLDLSNNMLNGSLPDDFEKLLKLTSLNLSRNLISGSIPKLNDKLVELDLHGNKLNGSLPTSIPPRLTVLDLHDNQLDGNLAEFLNSLNPRNLCLETLDLSSNQFTNQIFPENLSYLVNLTVLGLADIQFTRHHFPELPTSALQRLNLSKTKLAGNIPESIGNSSKKLAILDLSRNELDGSIPTVMGNLSSLQVLNLSNNRLSGPIPNDFANLALLSTFDVSNNSLSGSIPQSTRFDSFPNSSFAGNPDLCLRTCPIRKSKTPVGIIIGTVVAGIVFISGASTALFIWCHVSRAKKHFAKDEARHETGPILLEKDAGAWARGSKAPSTIPVVIFEKPLVNLSFKDLLEATANFSKQMQLADGAYGPVYRGDLRDGSQLAIKILVEVGFFDVKESTARIEWLAKVVKHPNLVPLMGYCSVGEDSILIYEYMVNGDLQRWLHGLPEPHRNREDGSLDTREYPERENCADCLSWPTRYEIALGTARGLAFLHHGCFPPVIHRDVKSSNILLDDSFEPHLLDSGLAGIAKVNVTPAAGGTLGYMPPEYGQTLQATTRGDVYSFGVVLLELVTGRKPTDSTVGNLVGWARFIIKQDKPEQLALDPKLVSRGHDTEMLEALRVGCLCTADSPTKRPTMQQVVGLLKDCQSSAIS